MIAVGIIIPVHNSMSYLDKCMQSCLGQTLSETEIILVDDASTDASPELIFDYVQKYPNRVKGIFLRENIRQGGARNRGLAAAEGEYVAFVDSDDWIEPDFCEQLYRAAVNASADMAGEKGLFLEYDNDRIAQALTYKSAHLKEPGELYGYMSCCGYFWNRIYRRAWLLENNIWFPERLAFEDSYFNTMTALYADSVVTVEGAFYHYYQSAGSTVRSRGESHLYHKIDIAECIWADCKERGLYPKHRDEIDIKCISILANTLLYICFGSFDRVERAQLERIRQVLRKHKKEYRKNPFYSELPRTQRWFLRLNMLSPNMAILCYWAGLQKWNETVEMVFRKIQKRMRKK